MFVFLLLAMVVVVAAVTLAVVGTGGDQGPLPEAAPDHLVDPLPLTRPIGRADIEALRLPLAVRGYRMADVDDVLGRVGAELAERDSRIAELEAALAGAQATTVGGPDLFTKRPAPARPEHPWTSPAETPDRPAPEAAAPEAPAPETPVGEPEAAPEPQDARPAPEEPQP
ncbi:DivIVA domain-containing protein [Streptomyces sp. NPDC087440]|uniref:DivIVA domain-containing protein n=1 Tax=Streptomyces sp. NPDC087440 TaxID=3365790 RepID=UPI0038174E57